MFQKVHLHLTILCAGITSAIVIIMSLAYLYVTESSLKQNQLNAFQSDMSTVAANLEQQNTISMEWLSRMESQGSYLFFVLDNGIPFLYNQLTDKDSFRSTLLQESLTAYEAQFAAYSVAELQSASDSYLSYHVEYSFLSPTTKEEYYASVICVEQSASQLQVIVIFPLKIMKEQIREQRIRFLSIDAAAILLLIVFSWVFTGILLRPIVENQKRQSQFVAAASHELRTPLAVILSAAECCLNAPPQKQEKFLHTIRQEGIRMSSLVNDMLTLSQSDNQLFSINLKPVELDTLVMNAYEAFEPLAKESGVALSVRLPDSSLPPCMADGERISQVISILLHNAISYTPSGGYADLSLTYRKERFFISVKDNGIGISDEDKEKIFHRFYRAEKARSAKGHFGLGLSIANEIIKSHKGSIQVSDNEGGGCIFTVTLSK